MPRMLFINWNDGATASQFSVSDDYRLSDRIGPEGTRLPERIAVHDVNAGAEIYLDVSKIRSAYLIDVGPDQRVIAGALG